MGLRRTLEAVATRIRRLPSALAAGAAVDHPSNGGITGDAYPARDAESDVNEQGRDQNQDQDPNQNQERKTDRTGDERSA